MKQKREFITNTLYWMLIAVILYAFFKYVFPALIPFVVGFIVAYIVRFFAKKIGKDSDKVKKISALVITICVYVLFFSLIIFISVKAVDEIVGFIQSIPTLYTTSILPLVNFCIQTLLDVASEFGESVVIEVQNTLYSFQASLGGYISDISLALVSIISDGIVGIPGLLVKLIITVVSTFFLAVDFDQVTGFARKILGEKKYHVVNEGINHTKKVILAYLKSYTLLFCLTFVELSIGLWLLRIPSPVLIAALIAIFDILPILGTGGILIPWAVICLFIGNIPLGIGIFIMYVIITAIRNTIEPKIVGKQIGLHPLATLMAMFVGMNVLGLFGLIFFPVSLVVLVSMMKAGAIKIGDYQIEE